jgi:transposase
VGRASTAYSDGYGYSLSITRGRRGCRRPLRQNHRPQPKWAAVHPWLRRPGVTLQLLWKEHRSPTDGYGYSFSTAPGRRGCRRPLRQTHIAGKRMFINYAGSSG